jgi:activator of HSP90 ATPase
MAEHSPGPEIEHEQVRSSDWIVLKSLLDTQQQVLQVMEQQAFQTCHDDVNVTDAELVAQLEEARACHERAIDDIETAIDALSE